MAMDLSLGAFILHHKPSDQYITAHTKIQFEGLDHGSVHISQVSLELLGNYWIARGNGMCLRLDIFLDDNPLDRAYFEEIANALCQYDLWQTMGVVASLPNDVDMLEGSPILYLLIRPDRDPNEQFLKKVPSICTSVSLADLAPLEDTPTAYVQSIHFAIHISSVESDWSVTYDSEDLFSGPESQLSGMTTESSANMSDNLFAISVDNELEDCGWPSEITSNDFQIDSDHLSSQSSQKHHIYAALNSVEDPFSSHELDKFCNAILRKAFLGSLRLGKDYSTIENEMQESICNALPTIFNPIYRMELCCRTPLIDSIARTFVGRWQSRVRSPSLRQKVQQFHSTISYIVPVPTLVEATIAPEILLKHRVRLNLWNSMMRHISVPMPKISFPRPSVRLENGQMTQMLFEEMGIGEDLNGLQQNTMMSDLYGIDDHDEDILMDLDDHDDALEDSGSEDIMLFQLEEFQYMF